MKKKAIAHALLFCLCLTLVLAACGEKASGTTMRLVSQSGTVTVRDASGSEVSVRDDMRLYDGYTVETDEKSSAYIRLDDTKTVKLDVTSRCEIKKSGRELEVSLDSGCLFFSVDKPLEADESYTIHTSTIALGIRGSFGWVKPYEAGLMHGHATIVCTNPETGETRTTDMESGDLVRYRPTNAGEDADKTMREIGFDKTRMTNADVPAIAAEEIAADPEKQELLLRDVPSLDVDGLVRGAVDKRAAEDAAPAYLGADVIGKLAYTGERALCRMSAEQARAFARKIEETIASKEAALKERQKAIDENPYDFVFPEPYESLFDEIFDRESVKRERVFCRVAFFDPGDGVPVLCICTGSGETEEETRFTLAADTYHTSSIYLWNGKSISDPLKIDWNCIFLKPEGLFSVSHTGEGDTYPYTYNDGKCYRYSGAGYETVPSHWLLTYSNLGDWAAMYDAQSEAYNDPDYREAKLREYFEVKQTYQYWDDVSFDYDTLNDSCWYNSGSTWFAAALDGKFLPVERFEEMELYIPTDCLLGAGGGLWGEWMDAADAIALLRGGADAAEAAAAGNG